VKTYLQVFLLEMSEHITISFCILFTRYTGASQTLLFLLQNQFGGI